MFQAVNLTDESEAFLLCDADEQRALFLCGKRNKLAFAATLKKSNSMTNIKEQARGRPRQRTASAGAKTFFGKPIDFQVSSFSTVEFSPLTDWVITHTHTDDSADPLPVFCI